MNQPVFIFEEDLEYDFGNFSLNDLQSSEESFESMNDEEMTETKSKENSLEMPKEELKEDNLDAQQKHLLKKIVQKRLKIAKLKSEMYLFHITSLIHIYIPHLHVLKY
jgi:hypothetical protein